MGRFLRAGQVDAAVWAVLCLPVVVALAVPGGERRYFWGGLIGLPIFTLAMVAGRRWPLVSVFAAMALSMVNGNFVFAVPVTSALAGYRMRRIRLAAAFFVTLFVVGSAIAAVVGASIRDWVNLVMLLVLAAVTPWLVGRCSAQYAELTRAGWERAERLERERSAETERARLLERARIAQDMHDSLGHDLSLLALRAGALELGPGLDEERRRAAGDLRAGAAAATARLHDIIGVLRDDAGAPTGPAGETVRRLVERSRASGLDVTLDTATEPAPGTSAAAAVHRVVQEALTNAAKHAPGAPVEVVLEHGPDGTAVRVTNPLPAAVLAVPAVPAQGGRGLPGLQERVRLAGGVLSAGPADGRFVVSARIPAGGTPVAAGPEPPGAGEDRRAAQRRLLRDVLVAVVVPVVACTLLLAAALVAGLE